MYRDFGLETIMMAGGSLAIVMLIGFLVRYIAVMQSRQPAIVNHSQSPAPSVMSRAPQSTVTVPASVSQTDDQTATDRQPGLTKDQKINLYRTMREQGLSRDKARPILAAMGQPLDNNLWAAAAPAEQPAQYITPIVGRPTNAVFESDPDYPYVQPPN